jgi:5'-nucleotidase
MPDCPSMRARRHPLSTYSLSAPPGERVDPMSIRINERMISPNEKVRVATNNLLAAGGARFTVFERGTDRLGGDVDIDALVEYFRTHSTVTGAPQTRIVNVD